MAEWSDACLSQSLCDICLSRSCQTYTWGISKVGPQTVHSWSVFITMVHDSVHTEPVLSNVFVRRKRPRAASQKQHHSYPVHPWQRSAHPEGEKPSTCPFNNKQTNQQTTLWHFHLLPRRKNEYDHTSMWHTHTHARAAQTGLSGYWVSRECRHCWLCYWQCTRDVSYSCDYCENGKPGKEE